MTLPWDFTVLSDISGWAVLAGLVLYMLRLVARRKWVPEATLKDAQSDADSDLADCRSERDEWKRIAMTALETNRQNAALMEEVRVVLRANAAYLQALPRAENSDEH